MDGPRGLDLLHVRPEPAFEGHSFVPLAIEPIDAALAEWLRALGYTR